VRAALDAGHTALNEWESKRLLAAYGIPVPSSAPAGSEAEAVAAAERLGGRAAMKAVGPKIHHKPKGGLVVLGVPGTGRVEETYRRLQAQAGDAGAAMRALDRMAWYADYKAGA